MSVAVAAHNDDPTAPARLTAVQWKSGIAAWLGWFFDGLDMHLYTIIAAPFVAELMGGLSNSDPLVRSRSGWIQAAFLVGWALGGAFFGRVGDLLGRARGLSLTILTYAIFTGLGCFAQSWWQLMIFRFLAALGIGGEWAVGSCLLSETWPPAWRAWIAAVLQCGVNLGILLACAVTWMLAGVSHRAVFLVGILPALLVLWIRRSVPETPQWHEARERAEKAPPISALFGPALRRLTLLTMIVCACSLTSWWAFMFWNQQHIRNLPDIAGWTPAEREKLVSQAFFWVIAISIVGNFFAGWLARRVGYRAAIALMSFGFFVCMFGAYCVPRQHASLIRWMTGVGFFSGLFGLFTMYLPPLFPTLLRTTGAGFSYNIGRLAAAGGTVLFGLFAHVGDFRVALLYDSLLMLPAMLVVLAMPDLRDPPDRERAELPIPPGREAAATIR